MHNCLYSVLFLSNLFLDIVFFVKIISYAIKLDAFCQGSQCHIVGIRWHDFASVEVTAAANLSFTFNMHSVMFSMFVQTLTGLRHPKYQVVLLTKPTKKTPQNPSPNLIQFYFLVPLIVFHFGQVFKTICV